PTRSRSRRVFPRPAPRRRFVSRALCCCPPEHRKGIGSPPTPRACSPDRWDAHTWCSSRRSHVRNAGSRYAGPVPPVRTIDRTAASTRSCVGFHSSGSAPGVLPVDLDAVDDHVLVGAVLRVGGDLGDRGDHVLPLDDLTEDRVPTIEPVRLVDGDEELRTV